MEFGPIWRALQHHKTSYILIALQIAVTMALMVNAIAIIQERSRLMARPTGVDEENIFYLSSVAFDPELDHQALITEDLDAIRNYPGINNAREETFCRAKYRGSTQKQTGIAGPIK
jgi:putative ABC transport system permease protein